MAMHHSLFIRSSLVDVVWANMSNTAMNMCVFLFLLSAMWLVGSWILDQESNLGPWQ